MRALVLSGLVLAACNAPAPDGLGTPSRLVEIDGSRFRVSQQDGVATAIRTDVDFRPTVAKLRPRAARAMEEASGCAVVAGSLEGDAALMRARLLC
ncbi:hypothetical protein ACQ5SP_00010 [Rhodovulum sp. YNF3179]|uniref:hypothetical protein n=1 Tax=Rhodovulum sp. YNF3179 TaxID=3425127 RepID=UPI003D35050A